jgi:hypothetical protein
MEDEVMKRLYIALVLALVVGALAGCGGGQATPVSAGAGDTYTSAVLVTSYEGALNASGQLALGTLQLEETGSAVTPEQAATLLPLWQALQGGVTAAAEVNAVLKQIEETMTPQQLLAIAGMQLTQEDMQAWMQENDIRPGGVFSGTMQWQGGTPGPEGTPQAGFGGGPPGGGTVSPEMATRRAEFANMSDAEREAMRATMEASGGRPGGPGGRQGGGFGGGGGQFMILLNPLIELLTQRAAE